jgi:uncharacterized membrane protein HdeD (DUF308 family)
LQQTDPAETLKTVGRSWGWVLLFGIITLIIGIICLIHPGTILVVIPIVLGIELLITGIYRLVLAFTQEGEGHRALLAVVGILAIVAGIFLFRHAFQSVIWITLLIGAVWIVAGIVDLFGGLFNKDHPDRGMSILVGILGTVAGIILVSDPQMSATVLAWLLGIWLTVYGLLMMFSAFRVRRLAAA